MYKTVFLEGYSLSITPHFISFFSAEKYLLTFFRFKAPKR